MAFIGKGTKGASYNPGWFLVDDEDCTRITWEFDAEGDYVVTTDDGAKYVPTGSIIMNDSHAIAGIAYEDVDVTNGNMPGSLVTKGTVYINRLLNNGQAIPANQYADIKNALLSAGIFALYVPAVTRPDFDGSDGEGDGEGDGK